MRRVQLLVVACALAGLALLARPAAAAYTESLPAGTLMVETSYIQAWIDSRWDEDGQSAPLIDPIERYEPGGGRQGTIVAEPVADFLLWTTRLQYGVTDWLSLGVGVPVVISTHVDPRLGWESGDYQAQIGRSYSEDDFWQWAESMGQSKPGEWTGNEGALSDLVVGARLRLSDDVAALEDRGLGLAVSLLGVIPTGSAADPEQLAAVGTTMWDLHFQGDLALHLSLDKRFDGALDGRLTLGMDLFYETFFTRTREAAQGTEHPLLLNQAPYVGDTYEVDPGDFSGVAVSADIVPVRGPAWGTWLVDGSAERAASLPPLLALGLEYRFVHLQQTDWSSNFPLWDWERERMWRPGYKNLVTFAARLSLFRLGVPTQLYATYRAATLIPGRNTRAADVVSVGLWVPLQL